MTLYAIIETPKGNIKLELYAEQAPVTVASFVNLAQQGFYKSNQFHRVIDNFVIQGGCPLGTGTGGPGYRFEDECCDALKHDKPGILSMANAGPGTNGSQFFITHSPTPHLDGMHTVFGAVTSQADMDVVNKIEANDTIFDISIDGDATDLLSKCKTKIDAWNTILEAKSNA